MLRYDKAAFGNGTLTVSWKRDTHHFASLTTEMVSVPVSGGRFQKRLGSLRKMSCLWKR